MGRRADLLSFVQEGALRGVADAGQGEKPAAGVEPLHGHLVLGQGAGLVGADHRGAAQGLDRREFADQRVAGDHAVHAQGQGDGDDRGQAFRYGGHGQAHRGQEHVDELAAVQPFQQEHQPHQHEADHHDPFAELLEFPLQGRDLVGYLLHQPGDLAQFGVHPGIGHDGPGLARRHRSAQVDHVGAVGQGQVGPFQGLDVLGHRCGFAGQAGLLHAEVGAGPHHPAVGRDAVPGLDLRQVAGHQLGGRHGAVLPAADHLGHRAGKLFQCGQGLLGAVFLDEPQHGVDDDDGDDGQGVDPFLQEAGDDRRGDEDPDDEVLELAEEDGPRADAFFLLELVGAVFLQAAGGFVFAQPLVRVGLQGQDGLFHGGVIKGGDLVHDAWRLLWGWYWLVVPGRRPAKFLAGL